MSNENGLLLRLVPEDSGNQRGDRSSRGGQVVAVVLANRWIVTLIVLLSTAAAAVYASLAPKTYMAEAVVVPGVDVGLPTSLAGQLGGLAGLAGLMTTPRETQDALVVLHSRSLISEFIVQQKIVKVLAAANTSLFSTQTSEDLRDVTDFFLRDVMSSFEDKKLGTVRISVRWHDPAVAAEWANALVRAVNERMRKDVLEETSKNSAYLKSLLAGTNVSSLQASISRLLESELQKEMIARGREDYALKFVDPANPPHRRYSPKRLQIVVGGIFIGICLAALLVLALIFLREIKLAVSGVASEPR